MGILRPKPEWLDALFVHARIHCNNNIQQIGLNHEYNLTLWFVPTTRILVFCLKVGYDVWSDSTYQNVSYSGVPQGDKFPQNYTQESHKVLLNTLNNSWVPALEIEMNMLHDRF